MEWIDVKDRLPELFHTVIVYDSGDVYEAHYDGEKWNTEFDCVEIIKITHWSVITTPFKI